MRALRTGWLRVFLAAAAFGFGPQDLGGTVGSAELAPTHRHAQHTPFHRANRQNDKFIDITTWENVALAVPAHEGACGPRGAVLVSVGGLPWAPTPRVWRSDLACFLSNKAECFPQTDIEYGFAGWPLVSEPGFVDSDPSGRRCSSTRDPNRCGPAGSNDNQLLRLRNGELLLFHQGVRRDDDPATLGIPCDGPGTCRGVEYVFRSTDCGASWSHVVTLDPALIEGGLYYRTSKQGGFDRPEVYVDPFNGDRIYMAVNGVGDSAAGVLLFASDRGTKWTLIGKIADVSGVRQLTSVPSGRLYIFGAFDTDGAPPFDAVIYAYDPQANSFSRQLMIPGASEDVNPPPIRMGAEGISRVGSFIDGDVLRVHYPHREPDGRFSLRIKVVKINDGNIELVAERTIAPKGATVVGATTIETDRLEWRPRTQQNPAIVYWYEISCRSDPAGCPILRGPTTVKYSLLYDATWTRSAQLAFERGSPVSWPSFVDLVGDYHKGAFWYHKRSGLLQFLPIWGEFWPAGEVHANTIRIRIHR